MEEILFPNDCIIAQQLENILGPFQDLHIPTVKNLILDLQKEEEQYDKIQKRNR